MMTERERVMVAHWTVNGILQNHPYCKSDSVEGRCCCGAAPGEQIHRPTEEWYKSRGL